MASSIPSLLLSPRGDKRSSPTPHNNNNDHHDSPVSVMGLYPVVHDLSEIEYSTNHCCGDPLNALSDLFYNEDSTSSSSFGSSLHCAVEEQHVSNHKLVVGLDARSRDLLQTPSLHDDDDGDDSQEEQYVDDNNKEQVLHGGMDQVQELPDFLPRPVSLEHRRRATSCDVVSKGSTLLLGSPMSATMTRTRQYRQDEPAKEHQHDDEDGYIPSPPVRHRRSNSDGAGIYSHALKVRNCSTAKVVVGTPGTTSTTASGSVWNQKCFRDEYVPIGRIFECNDSTVWDSIHRRTGEHYCVKTMENNEKSAKEIKRLREAQSSHTVKLFEVIQEVDKIYIVMELMTGGNLLSRVIQKGPMSEATVRLLAYRLIRGVLHLHQSLSLCHNDLQPSNILLDDEKRRVKMADFGAATRCTTVPTFNSACQPPYRAPERRASPAADMWSVGVILYFCLYGQHSSLEQGCEALFDYLHRGQSDTTDNSNQVEEKKPELSRYARQFLCNLIHLDPNVRLTAHEALKHPWLSGISAKKTKLRSPVGERRGGGVGDLNPTTTPECARKQQQRRGRKKVAESFHRLLTYVKGGDKTVASEP